MNQFESIGVPVTEAVGSPPGGIGRWEHNGVNPPPVAPGDAAPSRGRLVRRLLVAGGVVIASSLGAAAGYFVADDGDALHELRRQERSLERALREADDDLGAERRAAALASSALVVCRDVAGVAEQLVAEIDAYAVAVEEFMATPIGSTAEAEAGARADHLYYGLLGTASSVDLAVDDCLELG